LVARSGLDEELQEDFVEGVHLVATVEVAGQVEEDAGREGAEEERKEVLVPRGPALLEEEGILVQGGQFVALLRQLRVETSQFLLQTRHFPGRKERRGRGKERGRREGGWDRGTGMNRGAGGVFPGPRCPVVSMRPSSLPPSLLLSLLPSIPRQGLFFRLHDPVFPSRQLHVVVGRRHHLPGPHSPLHFRGRARGVPQVDAVGQGLGRKPARMAGEGREGRQDGKEGLRSRKVGQGRGKGRGGGVTEMEGWKGRKGKSRATEGKGWSDAAFPPGVGRQCPRRHGSHL
jgi:hypothetical protein